MSELTKISKYYDGQIADYDTGYSDAICLAEDFIVQTILQPILGQRVLDVGCGTGLFNTMAQPSEYVGVEISFKMAETARKKYPEKLFIQANQEYLPVADNSFDSIVSLYGPFSYSLSPEQLLAEYWRVLKPGGTFAIMPYTLRVGNNLAVGGYSTATEAAIKKIFYTSALLEKLFAPFENVSIRGINYFGNTFIEFAQVMSLSEADYQSLVNLLVAESELSKVVPIEYARHSIVTGNKPE